MAVHYRWVDKMSEAATVLKEAADRVAYSSAQLSSTM